MLAGRLLTICVFLCAAAVMMAQFDKSAPCRGISDPDYLSEDGKTCYRSSPQINSANPANNRAAALEKCSDMGGWLAYPRSEAENQVLKNITNHFVKSPIMNSHTWVGLSNVGGIWTGEHLEDLTDLLVGLWTKTPSAAQPCATYLKVKEGEVVLNAVAKSACDSPTNKVVAYICAFETKATRLQPLPGKKSNISQCRGISDPDYLSEDGKTCYRSSPQINSANPANNRANAVVNCTEMGGWLAYPRSAAENQILKNIINNDVKKTGRMDGEYAWAGLWHVGGVWTGERFEDLTDILTGLWIEKASDADFLCASYWKKKEGEVVLKPTYEIQCNNASHEKVAFICAFKTEIDAPSEQEKRCTTGDFYEGVVSNQCEASDVFGYISTTSLIYAEAKKKCEGAGHHLPSPTSDVQFGALTKLAGKATSWTAYERTGDVYTSYTNSSKILPNTKGDASTEFSFADKNFALWGSKSGFKDSFATTKRQFFCVKELVV